MLTFKGKNKKKIDVIRRKKNKLCRVICICSVTSSVHVLVPILKVLNRLGTVQVLSQDKSTMLLHPELETDFELGDIHLHMVEEVALLGEDEFKTFKEYDYNVIITNDFLPDCEVDKFIILNRRHYFRAQIDTPKKRYTPIMSVFNPTKLPREIVIQEKETIYVNERLVTLPSFAVCEPYLNNLFTDLGSKNYLIDSKVVAFVVACLDGIEDCTKRHITAILRERGELFVDPN